MRLTFLGTGSAMPTGARLQSGLLVEGSGSLLVDCGSGVLHALAAAGGGTGHEDVDAVLLSHHHADHVSDLVALLKARWLADADTLDVVGPPGTETLLDDLLTAYDYLEGRVDYAVREVDAGGAFTVAGVDVTVTTAEADHSTYCLAYRFGDRLAVSGDTEASESLAAFADGVGTFVHDCSFPDDVDVSNHPTPSQLGAVLAGHDYGTVYLTHLYPHTRGREEEMVESVRERYDGDVRVARDGLAVDL